MFFVIVAQWNCLRFREKKNKRTIFGGQTMNDRKKTSKSQSKYICHISICCKMREQLINENTPFLTFHFHKCHRNTCIWDMLEFYSPVNTIKVMLSQSVYLTTHFLGRLSPLSSKPVLGHILLPGTNNYSYWTSRRERMTRAEKKARCL